MTLKPNIKTTMRKFITLLMIINTCIVFGQNVVEVKRIEFSKEFKETGQKARQYQDSSIYKKIENLENGVITAKSKYEKYRIIFNTLGPNYTSTKQYDKAIDLWIAANRDGIFFPFEYIKDNFWPQYISEYSNNKRFEDFLVTNDSLRKSNDSNLKAEYFVNLPDNYNPNMKYPMIIILHGGSGDNYVIFEKWDSKTLKNNFISVYPHGCIAEGSFSFRFGQSGMDDIKEIYKQVISKYSVDTSKIIIAGQSDGGRLSIQLAYNDIHINGLFLAFPVIPNDFNYKNAFDFKNRNTKIVIVCGENDSFFSSQQQMSEILDSAKVENKFIKYPNLGHYFPPDFSEQLEKGLIYLTTKTK
jgi:predicted esterase